jgi:hypothetical protein
MKLSNLALALTLESVASFRLLPGKAFTPTLLRYTIIGNPDDEALDKDKDDSRNSDSQAYKATATDQFGGPGSLDGYKDYDELAAVDELNVDSFQNEAGGIVPGFHLSSLCSDD